VLFVVRSMLGHRREEGEVGRLDVVRSQLESLSTLVDDQPLQLGELGLEELPGALDVTVVFVVSRRERRGRHDDGSDPKHDALPESTATP
jgi:hypothetical protein